MKNTLAQLVGSILRLKYKLFAKHPTINVVEQLVITENVLIFMPNKIEHFGAALKSLENLRKLKPKWKITVITKLEMVSFIDSNLKVDILPYSNDDLNFFGLPKDSIKKLFAQTQFDLALDLKLKFDIISIILFQLRRAIKFCLQFLGMPTKNRKTRFNQIQVSSLLTGCSAEEPAIVVMYLTIALYLLVKVSAAFTRMPKL